MITIIAVSIFSYMMKALPFISGRFNRNGSSFLVRCMEYSVCFIMGTIIVNVAFDNASASQLAATFDVKEIVILVTIVTSYFVARYTGSILKSLCVSMTLLVLFMQIFL